jgi:hypothetical protein
VPYGHSNPLTKEKIAERIGQLDAIAGVLVAQLCHDTADMLRQLMPLFGGNSSFQSICAEPRYATTDCFVIEIHLERKAMGRDQRLQEWIKALRVFGDYLVECDRGESALVMSGRVDAEGDDVIFARMLQGGGKASAINCFPTVKRILPF